MPRTFAVVAGMLPMLLLPPVLIGQEPTDASHPVTGECTFVGGVPAPLFLDPLRHAELTGRAPRYASAVYRPGSRALVCGAPPASSDPELQLLAVDLLVHAASRYPREIGNGLLWGGRGFSLLTRAGARARWGPISAALAPTFSFQENQSFGILPVARPGSSPYAWYWRPTAIDWPQRFGSESFWWAHPGDSYVRADAFGAAVGFSTETLRWGPGRRYPLLMSGTAPGYPHVFLGTSQPINVYIGDLFIEATWGHLAESEYFDGDEDNDTRVMAGLVMSLEPRPLPGLSLGFIRAYLATLPPDGWSIGDYLSEPYSGILENRPSSTGESENQLFSIFFRWVLPESGFEVYGEYARDDLWDGWSDDFIKEPDHSAAVMAGLQKIVPLGSGESRRRLRVAGELVDTNFPETQRTGRPEVIFYTHSSVRQGYTHRGQLLGAPVGPAGDGQYLSLDVMEPGWLLGLYFERVRYAKDLYYQALAPRYTYKGHDLELTAGLRAAYFLPEIGLSVLGDVAYSGRYNRGFVELVGPFYETSYENNLTFQIGASWNPAFDRSAP